MVSLNLHRQGNVFVRLREYFEDSVIRGGSGTHSAYPRDIRKRTRVSQAAILSEVALSILKVDQIDSKLFLQNPRNRLQQTDQRGTIDLLTIQVFPLISKMLMNSEEQVQTEGVEALLKVSTDCLTLDDAQFLVFNIVQIIMGKCDQQESAKVAVLIIVERFAEHCIFKEKQCLTFLEQYLPLLQQGMLFKIKKFLLPALL